MGPQGPQEGWRPPWALWGPKGPRRARGASQGAPQATGNTGECSRTLLEKVIFRPQKTTLGSSIRFLRFHSQVSDLPTFPRADSSI